ncbi:hypothetical protein B0H14DRAFT_3747626 [Mycena olivaceomarginata]|nr:hypothetical protein B0H14DRAFT_3747626 [Mycena olivaceomarginata]
MVYKSVTLTALALLITPALGQITTTCFANPGNATEGSCANFITTFCTSIASQVIAPGDTAARCFMTPTANLKCDLTAVNLATTSSSVSVPVCEAVLTSVNTQCPLLGGFGHATGGAFRFFGDPNTGVCGPVCGN